MDCCAGLLSEKRGLNALLYYRLGLAPSCLGLGLTDVDSLWLLSLVGLAVCHLMHTSWSICVPAISVTMHFQIVCPHLLFRSFIFGIQQMALQTHAWVLCFGITLRDGGQSKIGEPCERHLGLKTYLRLSVQRFRIWKSSHPESILLLLSWDSVEVKYSQWEWGWGLPLWSISSGWCHDSAFYMATSVSSIEIPWPVVTPYSFKAAGIGVLLEQLKNGVSTSNTSGA